MHSWHSVDIPHNQTYMGNRLLLLHCNDSTELVYERGSFWTRGDAKSPGSSLTGYYAHISVTQKHINAV